jgi:hypothetical protein
MQLLVWHDKCEFGQDSISHLGHIISNQGVAMGPKKITAMV